MVHHLICTFTHFFYIGIIRCDQRISACDFHFSRNDILIIEYRYVLMHFLNKMFYLKFCCIRYDAAEFIAADTVTFAKTIKRSLYDMCRIDDIGIPGTVSIVVVTHLEIIKIKCNHHMILISDSLFIK